MKRLLALAVPGALAHTGAGINDVDEGSLAAQISFGGMVVSSAGTTSFDEPVYEKGSQPWLIVAGCSASCVDNNQATITQIVNSVRVGTAP